jgi:hypothetical protein
MLMLLTLEAGVKSTDVDFCCWVSTQLLFLQCNPLQENCSFFFFYYSQSILHLNIHIHVIRQGESHLCRRGKHYTVRSQEQGRKEKEKRKQKERGM